MLIFDSFKTREGADAFATHVRDRFGRATRLCDTQEEADKYDPFPFPLTGPIVLVERDDDNGGPQLERDIEASVGEFCGQFAGT